MTQKQFTPLFRQKVEVLVLSKRQDVILRVTEVVNEHQFSYYQFDSFFEVEQSLKEFWRAQVVILAQDEQESMSDFSHRIDRMLESFPLSTVVALPQEGQALENVERARIIPISTVEFFITSKLEYICFLKTRSQFFSIAATDIFPRTRVSFTTYIRLPLNQQFLPVIFRNVEVQDDKYQRVVQVSGGMFVRSREVPKYFEYITSYFDTSGSGLKKRARALFMCLCYYWTVLSEHVLFDLKNMPQEKINELYVGLQQTSQHLIEVIGQADTLWDIFPEALDNDVFRLWRAPWVATYAAIILKKSGQGDPASALMAGLWADVGLTEFTHGTLQKWANAGESALEPAEKTQFVNHPMASLTRCLRKNLPLTEHIKSVLACTHEQADEKGFPNQVPADKLPIEAQALLFAELIDLGTRTTMVENKMNFRLFKEKLWEIEKSQTRFSTAFLDSIANSLI